MHPILFVQVSVFFKMHVQVYAWKKTQLIKNKYKNKNGFKILKTITVYH